MEMIFDSSTLILLAKIDLLRESAEDISIIIPQKVKEECLLKDSLDALLIRTLIAEGKIKVEKARRLKLVCILDAQGREIDESGKLLKTERGKRAKR